MILIRSQFAFHDENSFLQGALPGDGQFAEYGSKHVVTCFRRGRKLSEGVLLPVVLVATLRTTVVLVRIGADTGNSDK